MVSQRCALSDCTRPAESVLRILPRRTEQPCCQIVARALAWPGQAEPISVPVCDRHRAAVKAAARVTFLETPIDAAAVVVRTVTGGIE